MVDALHIKHATNDSDSRFIRIAPTREHNMNRIPFNKLPFKTWRSDHNDPPNNSLNPVTLKWYMQWQHVRWPPGLARLTHHRKRIRRIAANKYIQNVRAKCFKLIYACKQSYIYLKYNFEVWTWFVFKFSVIARLEIYVWTNEGSRDVSNERTI